MVAHRQLKVGIFLLFLLATLGAKIGGVQGEEQVESAPYLDDDGNLCQDKMETFQDTQYETMIQCRVAMKKTCSADDSESLNEQENQEACHTVYEKKCKTVYRPHRSKVRVRICPDGEVAVADSPFQSLLGNEASEPENNIVLDVRPNPIKESKTAQKCHNGRRTVCTTKYHTECTTQQVQQTMTEDIPKCQVEMVQKCNQNQTVTSDCRKVPAMRCRIEKKTVIKTKPESKCSRVPRQFCRKEDCTVEEENSDEKRPSSEDSENLYSNDPNCYYRNQIVNEIVPQEKCSLIPKQMCHSVKNPNSLRRKRRSAAANSQLSDLRRYYLSRAARRHQMLPRKSRNFDETTTEKPLTRQICKMVPEQVCEKKRVNPKLVEKQMLKKFCRQPKLDSFFDQMLVEKLKNKQKSDFDP